MGDYNGFDQAHNDAVRGVLQVIRRQADLAGGKVLEHLDVAEDRDAGVTWVTCGGVPVYRVKETTEGPEAAPVYHLEALP